MVRKNSEPPPQYACSADVLQSCTESDSPVCPRTYTCAALVKEGGEADQQLVGQDSNGPGIHAVAVVQPCVQLVLIGPGLEGALQHLRGHVVCAGCSSRGWKEDERESFRFNQERGWEGSFF